MPLEMTMYDPRLDVTREQIRWLVENLDHPIAIHFADGVRTIPAKWLVYNYPWWRVLAAHALPVEQRHLTIDVLPDKRAQQRIQDLIYRDVLKHRPDQARMIGYHLVEAVAWLDDVYRTELGAHHITMSGFDIADALQAPAIADVIALDLTHAENVSIRAVEEAVAAAYKKTLSVLRTPGIPGNVFYPFLVMEAVSDVQLPQVIVAGGTRTDVDDMMITKAIVSSYIEGFADIVEYAIDARAAMKSIFYNAYGMPSSQYTNRKLQLQACVMAKLYDGDCGSTVLVPFDITQTMVDKRLIVGKIYYDPATGQLTPITDDNIQSLANKTIFWRSPLTCRHTDGFCRTCGGLVTHGWHSNILPGFQSVIEIMGPVAQLILSNKHVARTLAEFYRLPDELTGLMRTSRKEVYFRDNAPDTIGMRIPYACMPRIRDVEHIEDDRVLNDKQFSVLSALEMFNTATGELLTPEVAMVDIKELERRKKAMTVPYFSSEALRYFRDYPDKVQVLDTEIVIDFSDFDRSHPIMRCAVSNDSMIRFCKRVEWMFTTGICEYTSIPQALNEFSRVVYSKVSLNILHLEVALRANLITDPIDYRIPVVTDVHNVKFASLGHVIPRRSLGAQLAFEKMGDYLRHPDTYIVPHISGPFDPFFGFRD